MGELWKDLITARMDRRTYATWTAIYLVIYFASLPFTPLVSQRVLPFLWMFFLAAPRLRHIGWSPWLALVPFGIGFASSFVGAIIGRATGSSDFTVGLSLVVGLVSMAFMVFLAIKEGDGRERLEVFS